MTQKELIDLLDEKVGIIKTRVYKNMNDRELSDITYNSKACKNGSVFFVKGENFKDEYVIDAINNGAVLVVSEKEYETGSAGLVIVNNIRLAMVVVSEVFFDKAYEKINMIGLTGTKGKTTTATYINNIFNEYVGKRTALLSTIKTYTGVREEESHLSTPEAIELGRYIKEAVESDLKFLTMEVSSQSYKKQRILNMKFDIGLFLNISEDHISPNEHPNFNDYLNSKLEFIKNCKIVVINHSTDYLDLVLEAAKNANKIITYGNEVEKENVDIYYTNLRKEDDLITFDVVDKINNKRATFKTKMMGNFNVENATAAVIIAREFNVPDECIKAGILKTTVSGRMNVFKNKKDNKTIIVDYAHNKISFEKFFEAVKLDYPNANIYAVFGAPGGKAYIRRKHLAETASKYCKKVYLTTDDPGFENVIDICNELATYITCEKEIIEDRKKAIESGYEKMNSGDVLCLLAKGEDTYQIIRGKFEPYESDIMIAKKLQGN